jgi:tyrosinase
MSKNRREFLITASTGVAAGLLLPKFAMAQGPSVAATAAPRVRKNVMSSAAAHDLASLRTGVAAMKQLFKNDQSDPRGWVFQAFIHGNCTRFTDCQHGNWYFPPWHRSFIYYFEALIQFFANDPNFALPYWDWSRTHSVPASFYIGSLDDDISLKTPPPPIKTICSSAPTAGRGVSQTTEFTPGDLDAYVGLKRINTIQSNPDYTTYGGGNPGTGALEATPHNFVHRWVGGIAGGGRKVSNMVQTFSPMDPIFWLHHCNIDRLYSNWLARGFAPPTNKPAWNDKSFNNFYDKNKNKVGSQFTCGMTIDSRVMGYVYDTLAAMPMALSIQKHGSGNDEVRASVAASKATVKAGVLSFVTDAPPPAETRQLMTEAAIGTADQVVRLAILNVKKPKEQNTGVHVFIGPNITADTPITAPGYVGSFTFFEGELPGDANHADDTDEHHHGRTVLFNATEALRDLYGDTNLPEGVNLTVSMVTRPLTAGVKSFATVEEIRPDRIQLDVVNLNA